MSKRFKPPTAEELNALFCAFEVTDFIAQGGMGAVFRATQISLDRPVAIKILPSEMGLDPEFSSSFETEAKAMAKLNHPNLVQVYDFGNIEGMLYIVMEFVPGRSLYDSARGKRVEMSEASRLISDMCRGLEHAHNAGLIHRDIKPANVLIDDSARPKIVDFGLARPLDNTHNGGTIYGTRGYTAPEVLTTPESIDQRADIFSVGAMLYELLAGQMPPHPYIPASSISDSDPAFDTIILKAIHPNRSFRYPNVAEMAVELDSLAARLDQAATQPLTRPATTRLVARPASRPSLKPKVLIRQPSSAPIMTIVTIALILVAAIIIITLNQSSKQEEEAQRTEVEQQQKAQVKKAELRKRAEFQAAKRDRDRAEHRSELHRQQRIIEAQELKLLVQNKNAARSEAKKIKQKQAIQLQKERDDAEKSAELVTVQMIPQFDHITFINDIRKLTSDNSSGTITDYDASLTKNLERYIREAKRAVRKLDRDKRRTAELQADSHYDKVLTDGRIPLRLDSASSFFKDVHLEYSFKQNQIDSEYAPTLKDWRESYISNCNEKCATLDPDVHATSILYLTKEVELAEENWQRILLIAKDHEVEEPKIENKSDKESKTPTVKQKNLL